MRSSSSCARCFAGDGWGRRVARDEAARAILSFGANGIPIPRNGDRSVTFFWCITLFDLRFRLVTLSAARLPLPSRKASIPSMFLITPIQAAAVIAGNCLFGKVYITLRWRWFGANKILGNLWKKAFVLPNTNPIKELQDGHLKQDPQFKLDRATQLNESEWTALCLPLCFYFASSAVGADVQDRVFHDGLGPGGLHAGQADDRLPVPAALRHHALRRRCSEHEAPLRGRLLKRASEDEPRRSIQIGRDWRLGRRTQTRKNRRHLLIHTHYIRLHHTRRLAHARSLPSAAGHVVISRSPPRAASALATRVPRPSSSASSSDPWESTSSRRTEAESRHPRGGSRRRARNRTAGCSSR